jgi:excisionase family DNA binding protein
MNLADAIRQAALRQAEEQGHKEPEMANNPFFNADEAQQPEPAHERTEERMDEWKHGRADEDTTSEIADESPTIHPVFQAQAPDVDDASSLPSFHASTQEDESTLPSAEVSAQSEDFESEPEPPTWGNDTGKLTITADPIQATELFASDSSTGEPIEIPQAPNAMPGGNVVRFEIFLSPEQLSCLFRALVATQHSMMTLREAAAYLRIPAATLEQFAADNKIPALQLEGRWRFPKSGIDEWVMLQSFREGEVSDAA